MVTVCVPSGNSSLGVPIGKVAELWPAGISTAESTGGVTLGNVSNTPSTVSGVPEPTLLFVQAMKGTPGVSPGKLKKSRLPAVSASGTRKVNTLGVNGE